MQKSTNFVKKTKLLVKFITKSEKERWRKVANVLIQWIWSGANVWKSCRSQKMLKSLWLERSALIQPGTGLSKFADPYMDHPTPGHKFRSAVFWVDDLQPHAHVRGELVHHSGHNALPLTSLRVPARAEIFFSFQRKIECFSLEPSALQVRKRNPDECQERTGCGCYHQFPQLLSEKNMKLKQDHIHWALSPLIHQMNK